MLERSVLSKHIGVGTEDEVPADPLCFAGGPNIDSSSLLRRLK